MATPQVRILVDGKLALTTAQAAQRHGRTVAGMRSLLSRARLDPVAYLDTRTPLYGAVALDKAVRAMPGRGMNLRGHR
jgi:hypothetical protein